MNTYNDIFIFIKLSINFSQQQKPRVFKITHAVLHVLPRHMTLPELFSGLKKNKLLCGVPFCDTVLMTSCARTPPTIAQTGLNCENTDLKPI